MLLYLLFSNIIDLTVLMRLNENWTELDDDIIFAELLFLDEINFNNWLFFQQNIQKLKCIIFLLSLLSCFETVCKV